MTVRSFEDLTVWQDSQNLAIDLYSDFRGYEDKGFKDQILRAAVSISNNIAEGFERETKKEYIRYLYIAKGSCGEVRSMLYLAKRLNSMDSHTFEKEMSACKIISSKLMKLIQSISKSI